MALLTACKTLWAVSLQKKCTDVKQSSWIEFSRHIPFTHLTHFFAKSPTIDANVKKCIVDGLRVNRNKCGVQRKAARGMW